MSIVKPPLHKLMRFSRWVLLVTTVILMIPLVAMQFTDKVSWTLGDFVVAAALLLTAGMAMVIGGLSVHSKAARIGVITVVALVLAIVWAELAVGIFS